MDKLEGLVPTRDVYAHAHFLPSYGATGGNSPGHIKSMLVGNHCVLPVQGGRWSWATRRTSISRNLTGSKTESTISRSWASREEEGTMKVVAVGDNCVDVYYTMNRFYPTGNAVDFAINLKKLGQDVSLVSIQGNDVFGVAVANVLDRYGVDRTHFYPGQRQTATPR